MIRIGEINRLEILKKTDLGIHLDGKEKGEILLPKREIADSSVLDKGMEVFIYLDSKEQITATTLKPLAMVGEFALMKVVSTNQFGAFLDWGLPKDLFVPFREQQQKMVQNKSYIVYVYVDKKSGRITASSKLRKYLDTSQARYSPGDRVSLLINNGTKLGFNVIINNAHSGLLFSEDIFQPITTGQKLTGYIKKIREDKRIDVTLHRAGYEKVSAVAAKVLVTLRENKGYLDLNDKSSPERIYSMFGISKKTFKMAIGALYKKNLILIESQGIKLTPETE